MKKKSSFKKKVSMLDVMRMDRKPLPSPTKMTETYKGTRRKQEKRELQNLRSQYR